LSSIRRLTGAGGRWSDGNDFDLHEQIVFDEAGHLHGGTGWSRRAEVLAAHLVDGFTVGDVPVEHRDLAHVGEAGPGRLETAPDLREGESRLRRGVVSADSAAMLVLSSEALDEDQIACSDGIRSYADWLRHTRDPNLLTKRLPHHRTPVQSEKTTHVVRVRSSRAAGRSGPGRSTRLLDGLQRPRTTSIPESTSSSLALESLPVRCWAALRHHSITWSARRSSDCGIVRPAPWRSSG